MITATGTANVPFAPPDLGPGALAQLSAVLESGWLSTGPRVRQFEEAFASYIGAPCAVALNSCTAGLHLSLLASGVGPDDEVITTPLTFCATANAVIHCGATPVFADVDPQTGNLDPDAAETAITPRTRAIVPVHYGGRPVDVRRFQALARRYDVAVIEDAAHCVEGVADGMKIGTTADFTSFSFYATKNLTTGEGGMVTTASPEAAERIRVASQHGLSRHAWSRNQAPGLTPYELVLPGFKYNMMDLQAALGLEQLSTLNARLARRESLWQRYDDALADLPVRSFSPLPSGTVHARHLYTIQVPPEIGLSRDQLAAELAGAGIASSVHFPAVHLHRYYRERFGYRRGLYPHAEWISDTVLSLPFSSALSESQVDRVSAAVRQAVLRA